jgi:hypothetical protein
VLYFDAALQRVGVPHVAVHCRVGGEDPGGRNSDDVGEAEARRPGRGSG